MRKKRALRMILAAVIVMTAVGCSKGEEDGTKGAWTAKDNPKKILEEASKLYNQETVRGYQSESISNYDDGTEEKIVTTIAVDTEKKIASITDEEDAVVRYNTLEDDEDYVYVEENGKWYRYKEETGKEQSAEYEAKEKGFVFLDLEGKDGYENVRYSNEGIEEVDGTETVKIKIEADLDFSFNEGEVTRESVLQEYGWTEEDVALVEGVSELLDAYVASQKETASVPECDYVWVDVESHELVKIQYEMNYEGLNKSNDEANAFFNVTWQVDEVRNNIEMGVSKEDALKVLEEDIKYMEEQGNQDYPTIDKGITVCHPLAGDACPEVKELPAEYKEISQDEYFNGTY